MDHKTSSGQRLYDPFGIPGPESLEGFIGQRQPVASLRLAIQACKERAECLDHVLLSGPPGLGKTTLARLIAKELSCALRVTSGPAIERQGELAAILTHLNERDVLFIDEIHRLKKPLEELLYTAMEQFALDVIIGEGPKAKAVRLPLSRFTLIGATTRQGLLSAPLRSRFALGFHLDFYEPEDLGRILATYAKQWGVAMSHDALQELSGCSKGTPRVGLSLLKRVRDYAQVFQAGLIDKELVGAALALNGVDSNGLESMDRKILSVMIEKFHGGPVGIETLASAIMEEKDTIEDVYEPYLLREGIIHKTQRGRVVTEKGYAVMACPPKPLARTGKGLFDNP